jgi:hypothetical protein
MLSLSSSRICNRAFLRSKKLVMIHPTMMRLSPNMRMSRSGNIGGGHHIRRPSSTSNIPKANGSNPSELDWVVATATGFFAGTVSALTGVGGGIIIIPVCIIHVVPHCARSYLSHQNNIVDSRKMGESIDPTDDKWYFYCRSDCQCIHRIAELLDRGLLQHSHGRVSLFLLRVLYKTWRPSSASVNEMHSIIR